MLKYEKQFNESTTIIDFITKIISIYPDSKEKTIRRAWYKLYARKSKNRELPKTINQRPTEKLLARQELIKTFIQNKAQYETNKPSFIKLNEFEDLIRFKYKITTDLLKAHGYTEDEIEWLRGKYNEYFNNSVGNKRV